MMRMMMKSVMAGALVSLAAVAVSGSANAAVCGGSLASFVNPDGSSIPGTSCTVEDKTFSSFTFSTALIAPSAVSIVALPSVPANTNPSIQFSAGFVGPARTNETSIFVA
jgi:hypothetical protein